MNPASNPTPGNVPGKDGRLGATVLVGFLGSGKTTLLKRILEERHGRRYAVIVNDFAELNIDARLVRNADERLVEMSNGCICCTLREDLLVELRELSEMDGLDGVLIESTGIGEPLPIAQTFYMDDLPERVRLDNIVTVVDAAAFWRDFGRSDLIEDSEGNPVESALAPLLVDQLEFTNVVLLNKTDRANPEDLDALEGFVRKLNPGAEIHRVSFGAVDPSRLLDVARYDYEAGMQADDWDVEWAKDGSEAEEYGFANFVYRQVRPLAWQAFLDVFREWPTEVVRAKGFVAFADHNPVILSLAGEDLRLEELGSLESLSEEALAALSPAEREALASGAADVDATAGTEAGPTEIVLIGRGFDAGELCRALDRCVATTEPVGA